MSPLESAKHRIKYLGAKFADEQVPLSDDDYDKLVEWFLREPGLPNLAARERQKEKVGTGMLCRCGGLLVQTGTCLTCQGCGESSGGCS